MMSATMPSQCLDLTQVVDLDSHCQWQHPPSLRHLPWRFIMTANLIYAVEGALHALDGYLHGSPPIPNKCDDRDVTTWLAPRLAHIGQS
eukprot:2789751-Amphidinium_carterae.4